MSGGKAWYKTMSAAQVEDLRAMVADDSLSYEDIGKTFGKDAKAVSIYALANGLRRRRTTKDGDTARAQTGPVTLSAVEAKLAALTAKRADLDREAEELKRLRAELQLRFEYDGAHVLVHGVLLNGPLIATIAQWTQFLNMEGARKLREYIAGLSGKVGVR